MESVFLGCFLFGFLMVIVSVFLGFAHMALPGGHSAFHVGHSTVHAGAHGGHGAGHGDGQADGALWLPLWNVSSLLAFLMWFGAGGYAAMQWLDLPAVLALAPAVLLGGVGALLVSAFLGLVMRGETRMNPADYRVEGTLARVTVGIPEEGTGEIIFSKVNGRRSEGARSVDGKPIPRGEEVVVVDYQRGIALVQRWDEFKQSA